MSACLSLWQSCVFHCRAMPKWFTHKWPEGGSSAANKCEHSISHSECALKAIYIVKSNYPSSMREHLISILNRAEHIIKEKKGAFVRWRWLSEQRNPLVHNSAIPFLIIFQHRWKGKNPDLFVSWDPMRAFETWKPKEGTWVDNSGRTKSLSFCCFCLKGNQKLSVLLF